MITKSLHTIRIILSLGTIGICSLSAEPQELLCTYLKTHQEAFQQKFGTEKAEQERIDLITEKRKILEKEQGYLQYFVDIAQSLDDLATQEHTPEFTEETHATIINDVFKKTYKEHYNLENFNILLLKKDTKTNGNLDYTIKDKIDIITKLKKELDALENRSVNDLALLFQLIEPKEQEKNDPWLYIHSLDKALMHTIDRLRETTEITPLGLHAAFLSLKHPVTLASLQQQEDRIKAIKTYINTDMIHIEHKRIIAQCFFDIATLLSQDVITHVKENEKSNDSFLGYLAKNIQFKKHIPTLILSHLMPSTKTWLTNTTSPINSSSLFSFIVEYGVDYLPFFFNLLFPSLSTALQLPTSIPSVKKAFKPFGLDIWSALGNWWTAQQSQQTLEAINEIAQQTLNALYPEEQTIQQNTNDSNQPPLMALRHQISDKLKKIGLTDLYCALADAIKNKKMILTDFSAQNENVTKKALEQAWKLMVPTSPAIQLAQENNVIWGRKVLSLPFKGINGVDEDTICDFAANIIAAHSFNCYSGTMPAATQSTGIKQITLPFINTYHIIVEKTIFDSNDRFEFLKKISFPVDPAE